MTAQPYRIIIRHQAEVDITDAAIWYHKQKQGLGHEFLAEVDSSITKAAENPFRLCIASDRA
jgi:hypothetical protein